MLRWENVEECQRQAEVCRQRSVGEDTSEDRLLWLTLAEAWKGLAKDLVEEARRPH